MEPPWPTRSSVTLVLSGSGVAANVKLLLKLIQDHNDACAKQKNDGRRMLRVAGMMTILDNVRGRIQKCQSFGLGREAAQRLCNGETTEKASVEETTMADERYKLRRELNASLAARKSLEIMCSSLGKEKEIIATELAKKVYEMNEMEEFIDDLKEQNKTLLKKLQEFTSKETKGNNADLHERNKVLSGQLLKALDGYRSMKKKTKEMKEEKMAVYATMEEMRSEVMIIHGRISKLKESMGTEKNQKTHMEELAGVEKMLACLRMKVSERGQND